MIKKSILMVLLIILVLGCENTSAKNQSANKNSVVKQKQKNNNQRKEIISAPDFTLSDLEGNPISLNKLKGKVVLLNFWGTWCGPCRKEIPDFIKLAEKYKDNGLEIIGITLTSGNAKKITAFANKWNINYTLLTDLKGNETQEVTSLYGKVTGRPITGIPTTFLIDRDGFIRKRYVGPRSEEIFYKDLKPYL